MKIHGINHFGLSVADLDESLNFYTEILGLELTERRETDAFLKTGPDSVMALLLYPGGKVKFDADMRPVKTGKAFTHFGFRAESAEDVFAMQEHLIKNDIPIVKKAYERWDGASLYFLDPNNYTLEFMYYIPHK